MVRDFSPHPWQNVDQSFEYISVSENSGESKLCNKIIDQYDMQDEVSGCNQTEMQLRERLTLEIKLPHEYLIVFGETYLLVHFVSFQNLQSLHTFFPISTTTAP